MKQFFFLIFSLGFLTTGLYSIDWSEEEPNEQLTYDDSEYYGYYSACPKVFGQKQKWQTDRFAEQQFQETGWPARRGDELSDRLSR